MPFFKTIGVQQTIVDKVWYRHHWVRWFLLPFSLLYRFIIFLRRRYLQSVQVRFPVPIIVVGNITLGGVGKTPLVIALAKAFLARGLRVGIVSRGYGAHVTHFPYCVHQDETAHLVGDEPLLLHKKTGCPVVIDPKRTRAVQYLLDHFQSQIILSDDGLQHYAMGRALEIVVIDGSRGMGNGLCLPAGPLRESTRRLQQADFLVVNGGSSTAKQKVGATGLKIPPVYSMALVPSLAIQLTTGQSTSLITLPTPFAAVAAIGHPARFFSMLDDLNLNYRAYPFPDHYAFKLEELSFPEKTVVMTEKDAVKCQSFATDAMYYIPVEVGIEEKFIEDVWSHLQRKGYF